MKRNTKNASRRRRPVQVRAKVTVDAMLDAAVRLLKRNGISSVTTNRVAETAGVSIGSVYQYFPNKHALFVALHTRHIEQVNGVIRRRIMESEESSLEQLVASLLDGMVEAHTADPELSELLQSEVPHHSDDSVEFSIRFHEEFCAALAPHLSALGKRSDIGIRAFVMANLLEALGHAIMFRRPRGLSLARANLESRKAILAYLTS
jgi:AcrR family transcriptional regulator